MEDKKIKKITDKVEEKRRIIEKMERENEISLAEIKEIEINKEITSLINSFGLSGALERMSWDREMSSRLDLIPLKELRNHFDKIDINSNYSLQGDRITLKVIGELKKRGEDVDENKAEEIRRRYNEATQKNAEFIRAWADEINYH